jgi:Acetamidase/Formamidase family
MKLVPPPVVFLPTVFLLSVNSVLPAAEHSLKVTPQTIAWGYYWSAAKPVLTIQSGDTVEIQTVSGNPERLEQAGVQPDQIPVALRTIYKEIPENQRGPGGHLLTGPVAIAGAEPGDVLEVRIREIRMDVPFAYNTFRKGAGFLPDEFEEAKIKIIPLDRMRKVGTFAPGIELPLKPFFGSMGIAPPEAAGKMNSAPPGIHAGNQEPHFSSPYTPRAHYSRLGTVTRAWETERWTSRRWKPRSPVYSNSSCIRICTSSGRAQRRPRIGLLWGSIRI